MFASFHSVGNNPVRNDLLNNLVSNFDISSAHSLGAHGFVDVNSFQVVSCFIYGNFRQRLFQV
jgi:hypothetical protein